MTARRPEQGEGRRPARAAGALLLALLLPAGPGAYGEDPPPPPPEVPATPPILLIAPERAEGRVRVDAVATDPAVARVVYFLDGEEAGANRAPPFSLHLELEPRDLPRTLRAVAFDREGLRLGEDAVSLGAGGRPFEIAFRPLAGDPAAGRAEVELTVAVPPGARLDRVELYRNRELVARFRSPPFRARLELPDPKPEDYLRAVAILADGTAAEDARPLAAPGPAERLDVNLVELFAVATSRGGGAVRGLAREDFRVLLAGRELPIQRFREARQVPLTLAVLVDSSTSMRAVMEETREAAERFLERTLAPGDRAFLVNVETRPRLIHGLSGDPASLAAAFASLEAGGFTALYDSLAFAVVELRRAAGRRALAVLTDGHDSASHLSLGRALDLAQRAGVAVYVLSVGGLDPYRSSPDRNLRLEAFARATGGRLYAVTSPRELDRAYAEIGGELRSQYVLGVAADRLLDAEELAAIEVRARARGLRVRAATRIGPDPVQHP